MSHCYHLRPRDYSRASLDADLMDYRQNYFVPSFAIRRQAESNEQLVDLVGSLKSKLKKRYQVYDPDSLSMTVIEQSAMIDQLRRADYVPNRSTIESLASGIGNSILKLVEASEPGLEMPIGSLARLGNDHRKIGLVPRGWRGYHAKYARESMDGDRLPLGQIVDEATLAAGAIAKALYVSGDRLLPRTPHVTLVRKYKGEITENEFRDVAGLIDESIDSLSITSLKLEDPVIYPRYERRSSADPIFIRN